MTLLFVIIFCFQVGAGEGWVLWSKLEINSVSSVKPIKFSVSWVVIDAFEDFKGCKSEAEKQSRSFSKRFELNAGFGSILESKNGTQMMNLKLCLPAGTNPMIITTTPN